MNKLETKQFFDLKSNKIIFFGTGRVAQSFYQKYCLEKSIVPKPLFWCDNSKAKQGTFVEGIPVISPEEMQSAVNENNKCTRGGDIVLVIACTGIYLLQILCQLEQMGVKAKIYTAPQIHAAYYFEEYAEEVKRISAMFSDEKSRRIYQTMIQNMTHGRCVDFSVAEPNQYMDNDVIENLTDGEIFVDAGVCHGEEIDKALQMNPKISICAFEPDHQSMLKLREKYKDDARVRLYEYALWQEKAALQFAANTSIPSASRLKADANEMEDGCIQAISLGEIIQDRVTFIKMDIEGAEYKALLGAEKIIRRDHPKLAICVYHNIEDYVEIPLLIQSMYSGYRFYFRQHSPTSGESVFYAI